MIKITFNSKFRKIKRKINKKITKNHLEWRKKLKKIKNGEIKRQNT